LLIEVEYLTKGSLVRTPLKNSGVTDGEQGGKCPPWQLRCGPLFRNGPPSL